MECFFSFSLAETTIKAYWQLAFGVNCQMKPITKFFGFDCSPYSSFWVAVAGAVVKVSSTKCFDEC
jgi:hypothetical protein